MMAWAAETAEHGHAAEPFYTSAEFWVAVGFIIFIAIVGRTAYRVIAVALDNRAERITSQIDEATKLAEEAQALLATYERKQREASDESEAIIAQSREEADRLAERANEELQNALKRREELALDRIAQAEKAAIAEVQAEAIAIAMAATRRLLSEQVSAKQASAMIDNAIKDIPPTLN
jgi:F-type H+-transporting ATPase subunit b